MGDPRRRSEVVVAAVALAVTASWVGMFWDARARRAEAPSAAWARVAGPELVRAPHRGGVRFPTRHPDTDPSQRDPGARTLDPAEPVGGASR